MCRIRHCIPVVLVIIFAALVGSANAFIWFLGYIPYVRPMLPFALVFAIILFVITALLKARCGNSAGEGCEKFQLSSTCMSLRKYSPLILITGAIFIIFSLAVLATFLPFIIRTILAYIGAISFWALLFSFVAMIVSIFYRR